MLPVGVNQPNSGATTVGLSNVELAAKYRVLHQDTFGWDVAVFPRVFVPSGSAAVGDRDFSLLLPVWVQRELGEKWTIFGGGGCQLHALHDPRNSCVAGWVVTREVAPNLEVGAELFHQTAVSDTPATTSLGVGATYDVDERHHLLAYVRRGIQNEASTDGYSWYVALLFMF